MFLARVPAPNAPAYAVHQYLWGYFDLPDGEDRPFLFRQSGDNLLMLSQHRPSAPVVNVAERIEAGRAYSFELLASPVNGRKKRGDDGRRRAVALEGNERLMAWLESRLEGAALRFCQAFARDTLRFKRQGGSHVVVPRVAFSGVLYVHDKSLFLMDMMRGPGKGKCWGCGMIYLPEVMK